MNQENLDKLVKIKEQMHVHQLELWRLKKVEEEYYRDNMVPLIREKQVITKDCDHINPDGTSAIISQIMWGSSCSICGIDNDYLWHEIENNPNHPANKKN